MKISLVAALAGSTLALAGSAYAQDAGSERVVITHPAITSASVVAPVPVPAALKKPGGDRPISGGGSGGIGGAIGGYYINGTTPSDNRPLTDGPWPYR
jgi:hypothetical protein